MEIEYGMKELKYKVENIDISKLIEDLYTAIPQLMPSLDDDGSLIVNLRIFTNYNDNTITLWVLESIPDEKVNNVITEYKMEV